MFKKTLVSIIATAGIISSLGAETLKHDMGVLATSLSMVQRGFMINDRDKTIVLLADLKKNIYHTLGDNEKVIALLPEELKHKSRIAVNSGKMINTYIAEIEAIYYDKTLSPIKAQIEAQTALINIQVQCYKCHNLVRDWDKK